MSAPLPLDRRSVLTRMGAQLTGTVIARGLSALAVILIARQVGPDTFGVYAASMTLAKISSVLFALGLDTWLLRAGARLRDPRALAIVTGNTFAIKGALATVWFVLLVALAPLVNANAFPLAVIALCALIVWLEEMALVAWSVFGARLRNQTASVLLVIFHVLVFAVTLLLFVAGDVDLVTFLTARVVAALVGAAVSIAWVLRAFGAQVDRMQIPATLRETTPFGLSVLLSVIYGSVDVLIIAQFLSTTATGIYSPASTLLTTLYLIPAAAYNVMIPVMSRLHATNLPQLLRSAHRFQLASVALGVAMGGALWVAAPLLIDVLFGAEYAESALLLRWLSPVLALHCVSFAFGAQLTAAGRQSHRLVVQGIACIVSIGANVILLPLVGLVGAAWAFLLSEVVLVAGYWLLAWRWEIEQRAAIAAGSTASLRDASAQ